jgi:subtilisin family serine protease
MTSVFARRLLVASLVASSAAIAAPALAAPPEKIDNSYICVFRPGAVDRTNVQAEANRAAQAAGGNVHHVYTNSIRGFAANASAQGVSRMMSRNPLIAYCEQDQVMRIPQPQVQAGKPGGGGGGSGQQVPWGITRVHGGVAPAAGARAWIIDSGIDGGHPDLNVNASLSRNFSTGTSWNDGNGHGTHVAGTVGARNNSIGVIGVAPGVELVAVRVLNNAGSGSTSTVIAGIDYVAGAAGGTGVANMSLGGGASTALDQAVINAAATGVKFVLAAGNESDNVSTHSPARANGPNVYTVSAFGQGSGGSDLWASFSNFGAGIDYAEPGVGILSTYKGGAYATMSGTSMAAPHLTGLLLIGVHNDGVVSGDPDGIYEPIGAH